MEKFFKRKRQTKYSNYSDGFKRVKENKFDMSIPNTPKNINFNFTPTSHSNNKEIKNRTTNLGRNDKVNVVYQEGKRIDNVKYKKVSPDIQSGKCKIIKY